MTRLVSLAALVLTVLPARSQGVNTAVQAYAWAGKAMSASYAPAAAYTYNASGGGTTATRSGTGTYRMEFEGVDGSEGTAQVSAYGSSAVCTVAGWEPSPLAVEVRCWDAATRAPTDSRYTVAFLKATDGAPRVRYVYANQPDAPFYLVSHDFLYNPNGSISVSRQGTGRYRVRFLNVPEDVAAYGTVQVTPVLSAAHCVAETWGPADAGSTLEMKVACYDADGPADSRFTALFVSNSGPETSGMAFTYATDPTADSYTPPGNGSYVFGNGSVLVTRSSEAHYAVRFSRLGGATPGGIALVTAAGDTDAHCSVRMWSSADEHVVVNPSCSAPSGGPLDARYTTLFLWPDRPAPVADEGRPDAEGLGLHLGGPNPVRTRTSLSVQLAEAADVRLSVVDLLGREVLALSNGPRPAGTHTVAVEASALPPGVYLARLVAGRETRTVRFTVVR